MIQIQSDRVAVSGPNKTDGGFKITLETGEYSAEEIAKLLLIPQGVVTKWTVEVEK